MGEREKRKVGKQRLKLREAKRESGSRDTRCEEGRTRGREAARRKGASGERSAKEKVHRGRKRRE